ncbi:PRC-barrel domain-containing protein [Sediminicoccus sp. BL-A-41-H5]|uniref:PRC-barrel domain-containing protein n=1 Tax=Sediminicoccus sp. BL-A-41-H5 TaxID=3421106 RepID=UPI003D67E239
MHHTPMAPALIRMTLTAALLAAPGLAWSQAQTQPPAGPSSTMPQASPTRPVNPAADPATTTRSAPGATPGTTTPGASLNPPGGTATAGSIATARPRMSQIIGSRIYNDRDQNVGEVDDILLTPNGPVAIVQVGGFLGIGGRLVQMPLSEVRWNAERERLMLPGATKEMLETRPAFEYDAAQRRR